uniref:Uncharacterized protein n=1 Tax=Yersinia enterocolitica TaxID=630 RepID=B0RL22_YEREN|nr:hypothetical protein [Yersinia enterocolitica]
MPFASGHFSSATGFCSNISLIACSLSLEQMMCSIFAGASGCPGFNIKIRLRCTGLVLE